MKTLERIWFGLSLFLFASMVSMPLLAAAQSGTSNPTFPSGTSNPTYPSGTSNPSVGGLQNPLTDSSGHSITGICQLLKIVLNIALLLGTPVAMLFVVFAGFKLVWARGNPGELEKARLNLFWTLAGIAIFIGVWTFVQVLANTLGALGVQMLGSCS